MVEVSAESLAGLPADYDSALGLVGEFRPDVMITDVRMPPSQTDEGIRLGVGQQQPRGGRQADAVTASGRKAHQRDLR